mgnify:CR=1 FL=1|tara:strand:+ start:1068 stop:1271 length:204 start_codon:yes stop_codon:yes gene_type:complete
MENKMNELLKLSITDDCDKGTVVVANTILNKDMWFAEFDTYQDAISFLNNCFVKLGTGIDYNYYIRL